jgi:hypothetical protein
MALYMDVQARETIQSASSVVYGYQGPPDLTQGYGIYSKGTQATGDGDLSSGDYFLTPAAVKDAVLELSSKNIPRLGETYVCFIHPSQSRQLRDTPEFIEVTKYAAPGNFMLGEIGRLYDVVFIETTQVGAPLSNYERYIRETYDEAANSGASNPQDLDWRTNTELNPDGGDILPAEIEETAYPDEVATPGWDERWPAGYDPTSTNTFEALMLGDNAFGHAISLPVELRDGGVLDFGREHALAWYAIWGFGLVTDSAVVKIRTN